MALRGHASIQGSTDIPTLYDMLPGYLPMPRAGRDDTIGAYLDRVGSKAQKGFWAGVMWGSPSTIKRCKRDIMSCF